MFTVKPTSVFTIANIDTLTESVRSTELQASFRLALEVGSEDSIEYWDDGELASCFFPNARRGNTFTSKLAEWVDAKSLTHVLERWDCYADRWATAH